MAARKYKWKYEEVKAIQNFIDNLSDSNDEYYDVLSESEDGKSNLFRFLEVF